MSGEVCTCITVLYNLMIKISREMLKTGTIFPSIYCPDLSSRYSEFYKKSIIPASLFFQKGKNVHISLGWFSYQPEAG